MVRILQLDIVVFTLGLVAAIALHSTAWPLALVGGTACLLDRIWIGKTRFTIALGFFVGILVCTWHQPRPTTLQREIAVHPVDLLLEGDLVEGPRVIGDGAAFELTLTRVDHRPTAGRVRLFVMNPGGERAGDRIEVFARCAVFAPAAFPGRRSSADRAAARGLEFRCSSREQVTRRPPVGLWQKIRAGLTTRRLALEAAMVRVLGRRAGVPIAMLTGSRGRVTESERRAHERAGTAHLLAISGLHFGALAAIVWFIAGRLLSRVHRIANGIGARRASAAVVLPTMVAYVLLVGAPVSAIRACIAVAGLAIALLSARPASGIPAVSTAAVVLLVISPGQLRELGFQLSFAATTAIVLFWSRLPQSLSHDRYAFQRTWWGDRVRGLGRFVLMSWVATAATAPILLAATGELSVVSFITNLFAVPLVSLLIFPTLLAGALLVIPAPSLGGPLLWWATESMLRLTILLEAIGDLPGGVWNPGAPPAWWAWVACALVFTAVGAAMRREVVVGVTVALAVMVASWQWRTRPPIWRLHFIPVGQGDATLLETPSGKKVLVDAGGSAYGADPGRRFVVPYLRRLGIDQLDVIVVTHADTDHAAGVPGVLLSFPTPVATEPGEVAGIPFRRWSKSGSRNERSLVATIDTGHVVAALTGDIERVAESAWLEQSARRIHVLKVPHHGSKTSSTAPFLDAARPLVGVVSAGRHSRFGHPHADVVARYRERAARLFATPWHGLVVVEIDAGGEIVVRTLR